ncbi:hypothetical protein CVM73_09960 [Bradyrhizobium forestalis]|uniref:Uncharacterized protein n=1 Tax=Bradyrhizobium forestalis TaxID=1419263 RepID=A0A2M8RC34_9BRAD|nr:hypothetical protein CVM73_09960 [Bradyrhizobium forestalis]
MPGLVLGIHALRATQEDVNGRDKPGHDAVEAAGAPARPRPAGRSGSRCAASSSHSRHCMFAPGSVRRDGEMQGSS